MVSEVGKNSLYKHKDINTVAKTESIDSTLAVRIGSEE